MYTTTIAALEKFDNQHEFERMCADILNYLGYKIVELIAPRGGSDGGKDIIFTTTTGGKGLACVTLRKDIDNKFSKDFSKRSAGEFEEYFFFCTAYLTAAQKLKFAKYCLEKLEATLISFDIEALRSLLDTSLKDTREVYLHIKMTPEEVAHQNVGVNLLIAKYEQIYKLCGEVTNWVKNEIAEWWSLYVDGYSKREKRLECPIESLIWFTNSYANSLALELTDIIIIVKQLRDYELHFPEDRWNVFDGDVGDILRETTKKLNDWHEYFISSLGYLNQEQMKQIT